MIQKILAKFFRKKPKVFVSSKIANTSIDVKDTRDFIYLPNINKNKKFCILDNAPPIRQQGKIGSCASHAVIAAYEYQFKKDQFIEGSELFHYFYARLETGNMNDTGMTLRQACSSIKKHGFAFEYLWPYNESKFNKQPPWIASFMTSLYKVDKYEKIQSIEDIKTSLNEGIPIICGIHTQLSFNKLSKKNYIYNPKNKTGGGHAVLVIGYSDYNKRFIIRNSWGKSWGKDGLFEMPYDSFEKTTFDWWRILSSRRK